jgi:hypothetical protein
MEPRVANWFKKTEGRIFAYPALLERLKLLKQEKNNRTYVGAQDYDPMNLFGSSQPGSGAAGKAFRDMAEDQKLREHLKEVQLEQNLIKALKRMCSDDEALLLDKYYFESYMSRTRFMMDAGIGQNVFYRLRRGLVQKGALVYGYLSPIEYAEIRAS